MSEYPNKNSVKRNATTKKIPPFGDSGNVQQSRSRELRRDDQRRGLSREYNTQNTNVCMSHDTNPSSIYSVQGITRNHLYKEVPVANTIRNPFNMTSKLRADRSSVLEPTEGKKHISPGRRRGRYDLRSPLQSSSLVLEILQRPWVLNLFFIILNTIAVCSGIVFLSVAFYMVFLRGVFALFMSSQTYIIALVVLFANGIHLSTIGITGYYLVKRKKQWLFLLHFVLTVIIVFVLLSNNILQGSYEESIQNEAEGIMEEEISKRENINDWDYIQNRYSCCGVHSFLDWCKTDTEGNNEETILEQNKDQKREDLSDILDDFRRVILNDLFNPTTPNTNQLEAHLLAVEDRRLKRNTSNRPKALSQKFNPIFQENLNFNSTYRNCYILESCCVSLPAGYVPCYRNLTLINVQKKGCLQYIQAGIDLCGNVFRKFAIVLALLMLILCCLSLFLHLCK